MKTIHALLLGAALTMPVLSSADAWMRAGGMGVAHGGGGSWSAHGWRGGSASGGGGSWSGTGWRGGTASGGGGSWSAHGAYGGSASGSGGYWHATGPGGATAGGYRGVPYNGSYYGAYHPPTVINAYGAGCPTCGGWGVGAVAAGVVAGAAAGAAVAQATAAPAYGAIYATLPGGCAETVAAGNTYYHCGALWLEPAFGANGVYYRSVAAP